MQSEKHLNDAPGKNVLEYARYRATVSKGALWTERVLSALPVLFMLFGVAYSFARADKVKADFAKYGYPEHHLQRLVIVELICVILYIIPQTAVLGAILLTGYLGGATATHVRVSEPFFFPIIVGVLIWLGLYLREPRLRALVPFRT
jgi:TRAP-type C4-dicarboxylate transport system permease small subunit